MVAYVSAQFVVGGKAFYSSFGIEQSHGVVLTAVIILAYTVLGGFVAVSKTDIVQAFFMLLVLVVVPIIAIVNFGGFGEVSQAVLQVDGKFFDLEAVTWGVMIVYSGAGIGSPGNPHILVRYMSIEKPSELKFAAFFGTFWNIVLALGAIMVGFAARAYFPDVASLPAGDVEQAFPHLANY